MSVVASIQRDIRAALERDPDHAGRHPTGEQQFRQLLGRRQPPGEGLLPEQAKRRVG